MTIYRKWGVATEVIETLPYSDYEVVDTRRSLADPSATLSITVGFKCPTCKNLVSTGEDTHGRAFACQYCGGRYLIHGNALQVTKLGKRE